MWGAESDPGIGICYQCVFFAESWRKDQVEVLPEAIEQRISKLLRQSQRLRTRERAEERHVLRETISVLSKGEVCTRVGSQMEATLCDLVQPGPSAPRNNCPISPYCELSSLGPKEHAAVTQI